jgi:AraC-like DNA-binding protein
VLLGEYVLINSFEKGDRFYSEVRCDLPIAPYFVRFLLEEMFASIAVTLEKLFDRSPTLLELRLAYPQPDYVALYDEIFDCPVYFDQDSNYCSIPATLLDEPFVLANEAINKISEEHCETLMSYFGKTGRVTDLVRRSIFLAPGESSSIQSVAEKLGMSIRSLQRALQAEKTSFHDIHSEVRMASAAYYLKCTNLPPKNIAYLIGYSEVPNFYRTFKKWSGLTPIAYRKQVQQ